MNWFIKVASCPRIMERDLRRCLRQKGLSDRRISKDAIDVWQKNGTNQFFFSMGDWAITKSSILTDCIKDLCDDAKVDWDYEARPGNNRSWNKVI